MAILAITRITSHRSTSNRRYWSLYSESQAQRAVVFVDDLDMEPWLEEEAVRLRDLLAEVPEDGTKILEIPVMVKVLQDGDYYQVDRVVKGPESAEIRPKPKDAGQDWIAEIAAQIQEQVIVLQATIQAQQARIAELENEATDKQRSIDELTATVQTQQARITALESEADRAKAEYLPAESPVESVTEDEEDGAWSAAKLFHSVDPALVDEDVDDLPVPLRLSVDEIGKSASEIRTERLMHPNRAHVVLCYEASMDLTPHPEYIEVLSVFIETCKDGQYLNYSQAGLPQAQVDHLYLAGMLECSPAASYKLRPSAAGELWHRRHTASQAEVPQQESVIEPPQAAPPQEPVSLRSLLVGVAESIADADSRRDERATPQEDEDAQRPADDSDDLLDLSIIANIIGAVESDIKLIESMMKNGWECTVDDLKDVFEDDKNVFVEVIIDDINNRAQDEIDDNLLAFEGGRWEIHEDYRNAIETVLAHPDQYRQ